MKKILRLILVITLISFVIPSFDTLAATTEYTINTKCTIRTEPNEGGTYLVPGKIHYLDPTDVVTLVDGTDPVTSTVSACSTEYYYVSYSGEKGYVCGDYIDFTSEGVYYQELRDAGFPESYLLQLNALKVLYPNWNFVAIDTGLDWDTLIEKESGVGINYIYADDPNGEDAPYLSLDGGSYSYDTTTGTGTFIQQEAGGYYAANKYTVAYFMDPRNFLNERDILVFESNYYNSNYSDSDLSTVISTIFKNNTVLSLYTSNFVSTKSIGINPVFLAARSRQEVSSGTGVSNAASGTSGYYNFFNIGAYSSCINPVYCGTNFSSSAGWTTAEAAISGGAYWIYTNYTDSSSVSEKMRQNTLYTEKFNINNPGTHQFMTNIEAPKTEADWMYKGYSGASLIGTTKTFYIPVYDNMPTTKSSLPTAINEDDLDNANSGSDTETNTLSVSSIVNGAGYSYNSNYISGISVGKTANEIINSLKGMSGDANVTVLKDGVSITGNEILGTGDKITITNNGNTETLTVVIYGDSNGDGKVSVSDLSKIQKYLLNSASLTDSYYKASDANKDGKVTVSDLSKVQKYLLNTDTITQ